MNLKVWIVLKTSGQEGKAYAIREVSPKMVSSDASQPVRQIGTVS